jgi:hypothetical protein
LQVSKSQTSKISEIVSCQFYFDKQASRSETSAITKNTSAVLKGMLGFISCFPKFVIRNNVRWQPVTFLGQKSDNPVIVQLRQNKREIAHTFSPKGGYTWGVGVLGCSFATRELVSHLARLFKNRVPYLLRLDQKPGFLPII